MLPPESMASDGSIIQVTNAARAARRLRLVTLTLRLTLTLTLTLHGGRWRVPANCTRCSSAAEAGQPASKNMVRGSAETVRFIGRCGGAVCTCGAAQQHKPRRPSAHGNPFTWRFHQQRCLCPADRAPCHQSPGAVSRGSTSCTCAASAKAAAAGGALGAHAAPATASATTTRTTSALFAATESMNARSQRKYPRLQRRRFLFLAGGCAGGGGGVGGAVQGAARGARQRGSAASCGGGEEPNRAWPSLPLRLRFEFSSESSTG
jgi:hypothetical protein